MLEFAIHSGQGWLEDNKDKKQDGLARKRAVAVEKVLKELGDSHHFESFRANKAAGRQDPSKLKVLDGLYLHESTAQPKGVAHPSASDVLTYAQKKNLAITSQTSYVAARDQYVADPKRGGKLEQIYYNRAARMRCLLLMKEGKLWTDPFTEAHFSGPYAMDDYGNLFAQEVPDGEQAFNHSSFCRGKAVLCAGIIGMDRGLLKLLNNMSGHYKPGPSHLANALRILQGNGLDLSQTLVMCALGPGNDADRNLSCTHTDPNTCKASGSGPFMKFVLLPVTSSSAVQLVPGSRKLTERPARARPNWTSGTRRRTSSSITSQPEFMVGINRQGIAHLILFFARIAGLPP